MVVARRSLFSLITDCPAPPEPASVALLRRDRETSSCPAAVLRILYRSARGQGRKCPCPDIALASAAPWQIRGIFEIARACDTSASASPSRGTVIHGVCQSVHLTCMFAYRRPDRPRRLCQRRRDQPGSVNDEPACAVHCWYRPRRRHRCRCRLRRSRLGLQQWRGSIDRLHHRRGSESCLPSRRVLKIQWTHKHDTNAPSFVAPPPPAAASSISSVGVVPPSVCTTALVRLPPPPAYVPMPLLPPRPDEQPVRPPTWSGVMSLPSAPFCPCKPVQCRADARPLPDSR